MLSLQRKCIKACRDKYKPSKRPTMPSEVADGENDPRRPRPSGARPRPPRPSIVSPRLPLKSLLIRLIKVAAKFINTTKATILICSLCRESV